jgi:Zn-dependent membrane protease YugP
MDATNCTGIALDSTLLVQVGAALGVVGALAFASFAVNVPLKLDASKRAL